MQQQATNNINQQGPNEIDIYDANLNVSSQHIVLSRSSQSSRTLNKSIVETRKPTKSDMSQANAVFGDYCHVSMDVAFLMYNIMFEPSFTFVNFIVIRPTDVRGRGADPWPVLALDWRGVLGSLQHFPTQATNSAAICIRHYWWLKRKQSARFHWGIPQGNRAR